MLLQYVRQRLLQRNKGGVVGTHISLHTKTGHWPRITLPHELPLLDPEENQYQALTALKLHGFNLNPLSISLLALLMAI